MNHLNRPHCFLRRDQANNYFLSVLTEVSKDHVLQPNPIPYGSKHKEWHFELVDKPCPIGGLCDVWQKVERQAVPIDPVHTFDVVNFIAHTHLRISNPVDPTNPVKDEIIEYFGRQFLLDAQDHDGVDFLFIPHLYLTQPKQTGEFFLFIAVELPAFTDFEVQTAVLPKSNNEGGLTRKFFLKTIASQHPASGVRRIEALQFSQVPKENIVEVEFRNNPAAKGTVRHSIADDKPFDLDDI